MNDFWGYAHLYAVGDELVILSGIGKGNVGSVENRTGDYLTLTVGSHLRCICHYSHVMPADLLDEAA